MRGTLAFVCGIVLLGASGGAMADWNPGDPFKWYQPPDPQGFDVNATFRASPTGGGGVFPFMKVLADDFLCTDATPITDIHIWGSWLNDRHRDDVTFKLSIHDDVPAGLDANYSHPGALRKEWLLTPGLYTTRIFGTGNELFYDPDTNTILGTDTLIFQYNFTGLDPFAQEGTPTAPKVYWLDVQALLPADSNEVFGWKTSIQHWNDDAVFADTSVFAGPPIGPAPSPVFWVDMTYPTGPRQGQSMDMAFVITPEPATLSLLALGGLALIRRRK